MPRKLLNILRSQKPVDANTAKEVNQEQQPTAGSNPLMDIVRKGAKDVSYGTSPSLTSTTNVDDSFYPYMDNPFGKDPILEWKRANNQSNWEQAKNMIVAGGKNIVGGFLDGIASWDMGDAIDMASGVEKEYGNWFHEAARSLQESSQRNNPIYEEDPGSVSPSDPAWWFNQGANLGTSIGFAGEAIAEQVALAYATGGTGNMEALATKLRVLPSLLSAGRKQILKQGAWGMFKGLQEATVNGYQTFDDVKQQFLDKGYSESEAAKYASVAAAEGYRKESLPIMALNALQYATLSYNPVSRNMTGLFSKVQNRALRNTLELGTSMLSEGIEEGWQTIASKEGKYKVDRMAGVVDAKSPGQRAGEYLKDDEMWNSFIGGMLGGTMFSGLSYLRDKLFQSKDAKSQAKNYSDFKQNLSGMTLNYINEIKKAESEGNNQRANHLRREMSGMTSLMSHHMDQMNDDSGAFLSHVATLKEIQESVNNQDDTKMQSLGIKTDEDKAHVLNNFENYINDAYKMKDLYDAIKYDNDSTSLIPIAYRQFVVDKLNTEIQNLTPQIQTLKTQIPDYNNLSPRGKDIVDLNYQLQAIENLQAEYKSQLNSVKGQEADTMRNAIENLNKQKTGIQLALDTIINDQEVNEDVKAQDNEIISSIPYQSQLAKATSAMTRAESELVRLRKELSIWNNKQFQKDTRDGKFKRLVDEATSTEDLDRIQERLKSENQLTDEIQQLLDAKRSTLSSKEKAQEAINQTRKNQPIDDEEGTAIPTMNQTGNPIVTDTINPEREELAKSMNFAESIAANTNTANATIIDAENLFEPERIDPNASAEFRQGVKNRVQTYYDNLTQDKGHTPTFKEFVNDLIKHSDRQTVDKNFNILKLGWESNNYAPTDFEAVYSDLFVNRKELARDLFTFSSQGLSGKTEEQVASENVETLEGIEDKVNEVVVEEQPSGEKVIRSTDRFKTVNPNLKLAHLSMPYDRLFSTNEQGETEVTFENNIDALNQGNYVNSLDLMDPDKYYPGTKLTVRVPDNADEIMVANWTSNWQKGEANTFGKWSAQRNINENSPEYIAKVPMIVFNQEGAPVAFIHDLEWYNPINVGFGDNPVEQQKIIQEGRDELMKFRQSVFANDGIQITVTEKKPGTKVIIPRNEPMITINEANPEAIIGYANDTGNLVTGSGLIQSTQLLNAKDLNIGEYYDIRQTGIIIDEDGNKIKQYIALVAYRSKVTEQGAISVVEAIRVHLSQYDTEGRVMPPNQRDAVRMKVRQVTGLDIFDKGDLEQYVNHFVRTVKGNFQNQEDIYNTVASNSRVNNLTPFLAFQKGDIVFGIKGKKMTKDRNTKYVYADMLRGKDPITAASMINSALNRLGQGDMIPMMSQEVNRGALVSNKPMAFIDNQGNVNAGKNYEDYLKDNSKTNVKGFNIGTNETPKYVTFVQPVINFTYSGENIDQSITTETSPVTVEETDSVDDIKDAILSDLEAYKRLGIDIEQLKKDLGNPLFQPDYASDTDERIRRVKQQITRVGDMNITDRGEVVRYIARQIEARIDIKYKSSASKSDVLTATKNAYNEMVAPQRELATEKKANLETLYNKGYTQLSSYITTLDNIISEIDTVQRNWDSLMDEALEDVYRNTGITEVMTPQDIEEETPNSDEPNVIDNIIQEDEQTGTVGDEREKDYSKTSLEENGKLGVNYVFKRFLSQIPQYNKNGEPAVGYAGSIIYPGFDYYFDKIGQLMTTPIEVAADFDSMMERLKAYQGQQPWVNEVINKLQQSDEQVKAAFVTAFAVHALSMKFVMHSFNRGTGNYTLKVYDTNANEVMRVIQNQWFENFKVGPLVIGGDGEYNLNAKVSENVLNQFDSWSDGRLPDLTTAQTWLKNFGIELSDDSMRELMDKGYSVIQENKRVDVKYKNMFRSSSTTNGIFGILAHSLKTAINSNQLSVTEPDSRSNPLNEATSILKRLANIEKKYSQNVTTNTFRDGSKSIYGLTSNKMALQQVVKFKTDENYRNQKQSISFDGNSYMLELLQQDMDFREKFSVDHVGINAIKELGTRLFQDNELNSLSDADHDLVKLGGIQDVEQGEVKTKKIAINGKNYEFDFRMGRMFFPTMSDKKAMLLLSTAIVDFKRNERYFKPSGNNKVTLSPEMIDFIFSQTIEPELKRIIKHHQRAKSMGINPNNLSNQKGYNMGAQMFHLIPEMNNIQYRGVRLIQFIAENPEIIDTEIYNQIYDAIRSDVHDLITNVVRTSVDEKTKVWNDNGYFDVNDQGLITKIKYFNQKYLDRFEEKNAVTLIDMAAHDLVVNSFLANANLYMMFAGDIANYSQDKAFKNGFVDGKVYMPVNDDIYSKIEKDIIGVNTGKRLALLIAPGRALYNSVNDNYVQLFLKDRVAATTNGRFLIELFYGKSALSADVKQALDIIDQSTNEAEVTKARKLLGDKFDSIADYFDIESTDAQEYTTAKEAVDILFRQGRMHSDTYKQLLTKLDAQYEAEKNGRPIPQSAYLTDSELKLVFNPIKPVYTGQLIDPVADVSRIMYIKSSSFPLLPQVTRGTALDGLRRDMELIQERTEKNIRASYDTANKVGAVLGNNQLKIWDDQGNYIPMNVTDLSKGINEGNSVSAMVLDREYFRIQQDVPFKSSKRTEDTISIGTQMMKLMFGDGVRDIKDKVFDLNGEMVDGETLFNHYNNSFIDWISNEKSMLYRQVGIDESSGRPIDTLATAKKLQTILQEEATKRGYPRQDIDALSLEENGQFTIPVWLSPNSNRYEALLNAIVANRLINLKMPGNSFVVGSEEGFKYQTDMKGIDQSRVVWTDKFDGQLKAAEYDEDGNLKKAQVLVPSKFRKDGKLIDLITQGYATKVDGKWMLDMSKIDKDLLSISSFRIPTSGHVSMAQLEIVGFLPFEAGDLMIAPKNFTKQKGLDFDVDKENTYWLWHEVNKEGIISKLLGDPVTSDGKAKSKLLQNEILKTYSSVLGSSSPIVQKKINKVLSIDFARAQADLIQSVTEADQDLSTFTPLSDEYQKYKMGLGASGKSGIGVYSNYVVLHALIQQANTTVRLMDMVFDGEDMRRVPKSITIGRYTSDGVMGKNMTLDGHRSIGDVLGERQNTATDNEKEQIMGRVNVNDFTINVDSIMTELGFDQDRLSNGTVVSIPYLFLSQPIIKDYVKEMKNVRSTIAEFDGQAEDKAISRLMDKYTSEGQPSYYSLSSDEQNKLMEDGSRMLTGDVLFNNLSTPDNQMQQVILQTFLTLKSYADEMTKVQSWINIQRSGLGKSIFEMLEKYRNVERMEYNTKIDGISGLVGDYLKDEEYAAISKSELAANGYLDFGHYAVKPTTPVGAILANATKSGYELWADFFPHEHPIIQSTMDAVTLLVSPKEISESKRIQLKFDIMQEMKKYLFSSSRLGLFTGDPQVERNRLFFDSKDKSKQSLATYLSSLVKEKGETANIIATNRLVNSFTYKLESNGMPSLINYDNAKGEDINEEYKYLALIELMDMNIPLPNFNGEEYTSRKLAKDLIIYSYLQGGIQKATEFIKYIPIPYLQEIGFAAITRQWQSSAVNRTYVNDGGENREFWSAILDVNGDQSNGKVGRFVKQFAQHNARRMPKVTLPETVKRIYSKGDNLSDLMEFELEERVSYPAFVTIYNDTNEGRGKSKLMEKFQLYQFDGERYKRVPVLGISGMSEYSVRDNNVKSLVTINNRDYYSGIETSTPITKEQNSSMKMTTTFNLDKGNLTATLSEISKAKINDLSIVAESLLPYVKNNVSLIIGNPINERARASYNSILNSITINSNYLTRASTTTEDIARSVLHEFIHSITVDELNKYFNPDGSTKIPVGNLPSHVTKLHRVFTEVQKKLAPEIEEFKQWYSKNPGLIRSEQDNILYAGMSIQEFTAMIMIEPMVQQRMNQIEYKSSNKTLWSQFVDAIKSILRAAGIQFNEDSVTSHGIDAVFQLVTGTPNTQNSGTFDLEGQIQKAQDELNDSKDNEGNTIITVLAPDIISEVETELDEMDRCL